MPVVLFHKNITFSPSGVNAGAETGTVKLAQALAKCGEKVFLAAQLDESFKSIYRDPTQPYSDGVHYLDLTENYLAKKVFEELRHVHKLTDYSIIVAGRSEPLIESKIYPEVKKRIFLTHEPATNAFGCSPEEISSLADFAVCVSNIQREALIEAGYPSHSAVTIHNGADLDVLKPGNPKSRNYKKLIFVGALVLDKGLHILLDAYAALKPRFPDLSLDIYGTAQLWKRDNYFDVEGVVSKLPDCTLHGAVPQSQLAEVYRNAGLIVQPSIFFESFGLSIAEAQVCGLPAIGSGLGGMKEIIEDGVTGRLIYDITPDNLSKMIAELIDNPELLEKMSLQALEKKRPQFNWLKTASEIQQLIEKPSNKQINESGKTMQSQSGPKISIGIPTYNRVDYFQIALKSVMAQVDDLHEIIVVDDGSSDGTKDYLNSLNHPKIKVVIFEQNSGRPAARSKIVETMTGDFLMWVDDDDILLIDALKTAKQAIQDNPEAHIIYGDIEIADENLNPVDILKYQSIPKNLMLMNFAFENVVPNPGTLIKAETFKMVGPYNPDFPRSQDREFWTRAAIADCNFAYHGKCFYRMRYHENNLANPEVNKNQSKYHCMVLQHMLASVELERIFPLNDWENNPEAAATQSLQQLSKIFFDHGDDQSALECLEIAENYKKEATTLVLKAFILRAMGKDSESLEYFAEGLSALDEIFAHFNVKPGVKRGSEAVAENSEDKPLEEPISIDGPSMLLS